MRSHWSIGVFRREYVNTAVCEITLSVFPEKKYFIKAIENFFSVLPLPHLNTREVGRILESYANSRRRIGFA